MAYTIYVKNEQGDPIVSLGVGGISAGTMVYGLWEMHKEGKIRKEAGGYMIEVFILDNHMAVPLIVKHVEESLRFLENYLDKPNGQCDYQKEVYRYYEGRIDRCKSLTDDFYYFEVWDLS